MSISRDVIVANAHQDPGPEGVRLFDTGYLVAVAGFLVFTNGFPVVQFLTHGNPHLAQCRTEGANHEVQSGSLIGPDHSRYCALIGRIFYSGLCIIGDALMP